MVITKSIYIIKMCVLIFYIFMAKLAVLFKVKLKLSI